MNEKLVTIARFTDYIEAELSRQLLEGEGIRAFVSGQNVANVYGGVPAAIDIQLQTPESQADEAKEILEASRQRGDGGLQQEDEGDLEQDWDDDDGLEEEQDEDLEQE
jgi:hypothetical protein